MNYEVNIFSTHSLKKIIYLNIIREYQLNLVEVGF